MPLTTVKTAQIGSAQVVRADLNTTTPGSAVVEKVIAGKNITISSTGIDAGTGDVTILTATSLNLSSLQVQDAPTGTTLWGVDASGKPYNYGAGQDVLGLANPTPTALAINSTGTTAYRYIVTALNALGETVGSSTTITNGVATLNSSNTVQVSWLAVPGATSYKVYGRTTGSQLYMATVVPPILSYIDTGAITPAGALPSAPAGTKLTIKGWQSQANKLQEWQDSTGTVNASIDTSGNIATAGTVTLSAAASRIIPGATSLSIRNNANTADNQLFTDSGMQQGAGIMRSTGAGVVGATGAAAELFNNSGTATMLGFNRTTSAYIPVSIDGSTIQIGTAGHSMAVLGATPAVQQTGGAKTAAVTYGANEQSMLQTIYNMGRTFGFLS